MAKFYFTKRAVEDLSSIWNYTFEVWSEEQADKYYRMLIEVCRKLTCLFRAIVGHRFR